MASRTFKNKKHQHSRVFFCVVFYVYTKTWVKEKELERVIENKGDEFRRKKNMKIQSAVYTLVRVSRKSQTVLYK